VGGVGGGGGWGVCVFLGGGVCQGWGGLGGGGGCGGLCGWVGGGVGSGVNLLTCLFSFPWSFWSSLSSRPFFIPTLSEPIVVVDAAKTESSFLHFFYLKSRTLVTSYTVHIKPGFWGVGVDVASGSRSCFPPLFIPLSQSFPCLLNPFLPPRTCQIQQSTIRENPLSLPELTMRVAFSFFKDLSSSSRPFRSLLSSPLPFPSLAEQSALPNPVYITFRGWGANLVFLFSFFFFLVVASISLYPPVIFLYPRCVTMTSFSG